MYIYIGVDEYEEKKRNLIIVEKDRVEGIEIARLAEIERFRYVQVFF
jgi:hypothetical protein